MATERIEETILRNLLYNEEYYRKVVPFLKAEYFNEYHERILFEEVADFASKYDKVPTQEVLSINLQSRNDLTEDAFQSSLSTLKSLGDEWVDFNWLLDATEKWCQDRAIYLALMQSIKIADGGDKKLSKDAIPSILQAALAVSFDEHIDTITLNKQKTDMISTTARKKRSRLTLISLTSLQKVVSLTRLSTSLLLVQASGNLYSCAMRLLPRSLRTTTFSTLHVKWQRRKLLSELTQTF